MRAPSPRVISSRAPSITCSPADRAQHHEASNRVHGSFPHFARAGNSNPGETLGCDLKKMVNYFVLMLSFAHAKRKHIPPRSADRSHTSIRAPQNSGSVARRLGLRSRCSKPAAIWTGRTGGRRFWTGRPVHEFSATRLANHPMDGADGGSRHTFQIPVGAILFLTESHQSEFGTCKPPVRPVHPSIFNSLSGKSLFFVGRGVVSTPRPPRPSNTKVPT